MNNYRTTRNYENINKIYFDGIGKYDIPQILPQDYTECDFIGFNYATSCKNTENKGVHFFLDDYQFNRVWDNPDKYIGVLSKFSYVLSPDFSLYTDFPKALQIYNHYRKHWVGAYLQEAGIKVIPTISWSTPDSFEWCFDGEPIHSCVAISSVGAANSKEKKKLFLAGYNEMLKRLEPTQIIFYGKVPEECKGNIIQIKQFSDRFSEVKIANW